MSIWASWAAPDSDAHLDSCARWEKRGNMWEISGRPCDCGQPDAPLVYYGSNVLPDESGERGGYVDIASLSAFVRHYRDHPDSDDEPEGLEPFLRLGVNEGTVVLTRRNVEQIHAALTEWLDALGNDTDTRGQE